MNIDSCSSQNIIPAAGDPLFRVLVKATARLHMGFIDLHGGLGRQFGSIGLSLEHPVTYVSATAQPKLTANGPQRQRVLDYASRFSDAANLPGGAHIEILEAIPDHAGLGSGTQLGLAVGVALSRLYRLDLSVREIALLTGRGRRSGIGIGAFEQGGLLVDGGRGENTMVPPIVSRMVFPDQWRILLVFDPVARGIHGQSEIKAFSELPEFSATQASNIARLVLMQVLPALAEQDLQVFGEAIATIQQAVGEHFAPAQGGGLYISPNVADVMHELKRQGVVCLGQSSWGPTGFAVVRDETEATRLAQHVRAKFPNAQIEICRARNQGSEVSEN